MTGAFLYLIEKSNEWLEKYAYIYANRGECVFVCSYCIDFIYDRQEQLSLAFKIHWAGLDAFDNLFYVVIRLRFFRRFFQLFL